MADSGRIERVVVMYRETPDLPWKPIPDGLTALGVAAKQWAEDKEFEVDTFIPESDHTAEIERLAGELEGVLTDFRKVIPIDLDEDNQNAFDAALYRLIKLSASLTRGERE